MKKISNTSKAVAAATGTGILATTISVPLIMEEQASKYALWYSLKNSGLTPFEAQTDKNLILTSLSQGLEFPFQSFSIRAGAFYAGSPEIKVEVTGDQGIDINNPAVDLLHQNCLKALNEAGGFESTVRKWCAEITIEEILKRQGLKPLITEEQAKNSLIHKLILPISEFSIEKDTFYDNSSQISITTKPDGSEKFFQLVQPKVEFKKQCLQALKSKELGDKQKYLKNAHTWCLQLSVKDVLIRNGFEPLTGDESDDVWKEIIAGGWFLGGSFFMKNVLVSQQKLFNVTGTGRTDFAASGGINNIDKVENKHISALKKECSKLLKQPFVREKFPRSFDSNQFPLFDSFQEASWFCVKPITAEDYVKNTLKKTIEESNRTSCKNNLEWKTFKVYEGSSQYSDFWEAVRFIASPSSSNEQVSCIKKTN